MQGSLQRDARKFFQGSWFSFPGVLCILAMDQLCSLTIKHLSQSWEENPSSQYGYIKDLGEWFNNTTAFKQN